VRIASEYSPVSPEHAPPGIRKRARRGPGQPGVQRVRPGFFPGIARGGHGDFAAIGDGHFDPTDADSISTTSRVLGSAAEV
jgi:hypothetical protein